MKPMQLAAIPAAAVAAGVLMPSWTPNRRLASATLIAGACSLADLSRGQTYLGVTGLPRLPFLDAEQSRKIDAAVGYAAKAGLLQTVVEVVRLVSVKDRVAGAALLGGAYVLASAKFQSTIEQMLAASADAEELDDEPAAHAS